jgi:hypothetical protein
MPRVKKITKDQVSESLSAGRQNKLNLKNLIKSKMEAQNQANEDGEEEVAYIDDNEPSEEELVEEVEEEEEKPVKKPVKKVQPVVKQEVFGAGKLSELEEEIKRLKLEKEQERAQVAQEKKEKEERKKQKKQKEEELEKTLKALKEDYDFRAQHKRHIVGTINKSIIDIHNAIKM